MPHAIGQVTTTSGNLVSLAATAYAEQSSGAQRSIKSASASDTSDGTGARKVKITYYTLATDGAIAGPKSEIVTMNGTTAVATVATDIALVERMEIVEVGSDGIAAGDITLYDDNAGAGSAIGSIGSNDLVTRWAHHYVPSNRACQVTDLDCFGGNAAFALVMLTSNVVGSDNFLPLTGWYATSSTVPRGATFNDSIWVPGPARVRMVVLPANTTSQTTYGSFGYVDKASGI